MPVTLIQSQLSIWVHIWYISIAHMCREIKSHHLPHKNYSLRGKQAPTLFMY